MTEIDRKSNAFRGGGIDPAEGLIPSKSESGTAVLDTAVRPDPLTPQEILFRAQVASGKQVVHQGGESVISLAEIEGERYALKQFHKGNTTGFTDKDVSNGNALEYYTAIFSDPYCRGSTYTMGALDVIAEDSQFMLSRFVERPNLQELMTYVMTEDYPADADPSRRVMIEQFVNDNPIENADLQAAVKVLMADARKIESDSFVNIYGARFYESHFLVDKIEDGKLHLLLADLR